MLGGSSLWRATVAPLTPVIYRNFLHDFTCRRPNWWNTGGSRSRRMIDWDFQRTNLSWMRRDLRSSAV